MTAGIVASITAVTPTERLKTALIDDARNERRFRSAPHAIRLLVKENGFILGLYRGFVGTTLKQATATSVRLGSYNVIKQFEENWGISQGTATNFLNGSIAGTITVYTTQPFDTLKTRGQSARGVALKEAFVSILKDGGVRGFWRGSTMRLGRVVFSGGILFTTYEKTSQALHTLYGKASKETL
jgi:solute carrier family 25 citrate transporter 1